MAAVTFDLWHTLLYLTPEDENRYMRSLLAIGTGALARAPRIPGTPEVGEGALGAAFESSYVRAVEESGQGHTVTPVDQLLRAGAQTGRLPSIDEYLSEVERLIRGAPFRPAPGALELFRSLGEDGYWLAVISNTTGEPGAFLRPVVRSMGFDLHVRTYTFSDEHPWTKPAPEIFRKTLEEGGVLPTETVHVGDGWSDMEGARRAGLRAGILYTGLHDYGPRYRELFAPNDRPVPTSAYQASDLKDVGRLVRTILAR